MDYFDSIAEQEEESYRIYTSATTLEFNKYSEWCWYWNPLFWISGF